MAELNDKYNIPTEFIDNDELYLHEASEHASSVETAQNLVRVTALASAAEVPSKVEHATDVIDIRGARNAGQLLIEMRDYYRDGHIAA